MSGGPSFASALYDLNGDLDYHDGAGTAAIAAGTGGELTVRVKAGAPPAGSRDGDHRIHVWSRAQQDGAAYRVSLLQGDESVWTSPVTTSPAAFERQILDIPQGFAQSITDYSNLRVRVHKSGSENLLLTKLYVEVGEDRAPGLGLPDVPHTSPDTLDVGQFEVDPLARAVAWQERDDDVAPTIWTAYCALLDQSTGLLSPPDGRGVSMGLVKGDASTQIGRTANGAFGVALDPNGYIVTCDIDESHVGNSTVTVWSGPELDPDEDTPGEREQRASIFGTKDFSQGDRIVVYQYRDLDNPGWELRAVNLDEDPLTHHVVWAPPPPPQSRVNALILSSQRTLDGTSLWFWGCYPSTEPGTKLQVCRTDFSSLPDVTVTQITDSPEDVLYGWAFTGADGRQRWAAGSNPADGGIGVPGMRMFVEAEPYWEVEAEYQVNTDLWTPSFVTASRGQTPEVVGPDANGKYYLTWSVHDEQDSVGPVAVSAYGKILLAEVGRPGRVAVVSRKQNHQVQTEPEPYIANGKLYISYTETRTGPAPYYGAASQQQRLIVIDQFPPP